MADVVLVDDYNRPTLGAAPNGTAYLQPGGGWSTASGSLRPSAGLVIYYNTGHVDLAATLELASTVAAFSTALVVRRDSDGNQVELTAGSNGTLSLNGKNGPLDSWPGEASGLGAGDTIGLVATGNEYQVVVNGTVAHVVTDGSDPDPTGTGVGVYEFLPNFVDTTGIASLTVEYDQAAGLSVHAGQAQPASTATSAHIGAHPAVVPPELVFVDTFNRGTLGGAPNGQPYEGSGNWAITANQAQPTSVGDSQLVVDVGVTEWTASFVVGANNANHDVGLIARWVDAGDFLAISVRPDVQEILFYRRAGGGFTVLHEWFSVPGTSDPTGRTLQVAVTGDTFAVTFDGNTVGTVTTADYATSTKLGIWSYNTAIPFDDLTWSIAPPPLTASETETAHLVAHPGDGHVAVPIYSDPAVAVIHAGTATVEDPTDAVVVAMGGAIRGPVAYGPRISQPGTYTPPIVARVYRLRDWRHPIVTLDQSFARTWQEQMGEAGSGSVTLLNDDPDLALIRDGDIIRFELYGEAAFSFVVTGRDKTTIAQGEEHDETTTLTGPGLLAWLTDSMLVYPARQPPADIHGPSFDRYIQGAPVEEDRIFSWASYAQLVDNDLYGPVVDIGPMPEPLPTENGWPEGVVAQRIWVPAGPLVGQVYYRMGFTCTEPTVEIYLHAPLMDPIKVWLDGSLVADSPGGLDYGDVQVVGGDTSTLGTDQHVLCVWVDHQGGDAWLAAVGIGVDDEGEYTGQVMGTSTDWVAVAYPPSPPPVTAGAVIEAVLGEMNSRRYNPQMGTAFTIETDSDGNPWPPLPEITTKVGTSVWTFLQELSDYVEVYMAHDPNALYGWVVGGRGSERNVTLHGPTDPHDPDSSNLRGLTHKRAT